MKLVDQTQIDLVRGNLHATIDVQIDRLISTLTEAPEPTEEVPDNPGPVVVPDEAEEKTAPKSPESFGKRADIIPFAVQHKKRMATHGVYAHGYPTGAVVHFTAGAFSHGAADAVNVISYGVDTTGYTYLAIARDGTLVQAHPVSRWGYHAGISSWPGLGSGLNSKWIGIEICCAGLCKKNSDGTFVSDAGIPVPTDQIRHIPTARYKGEIPGYYQSYSSQQEATLKKLLLWLRVQGDGVFQISYIGGHDEVRTSAGNLGGKNDPGGSLSMGMPKLRDELRAIWLSPDRDAKLKAMGVL